MRHIKTISLLLIFFMVGCSTLSPIRSKKESAFLELIPGVTIANKLELSPLSPDVDVLVLENFEDYCIQFPADYNARLFTYDPQAEEWLEIKNNMGFPSPEPAVVCPEVSSGLVPFFPDISGDEKITLRIVVSGEKLADGISTGEMAGAYIEFQWDPSHNTLPDFWVPQPSTDL